MDEQAVTTAELANRLRCSKAKIIRMVRAGTIPGFKIGREWRFFEQDVLESLRAPKDSWAQSVQSQRARRRKAA